MQSFFEIQGDCTGAEPWDVLVVIYIINGFRTLGNLIIILTKVCFGLVGWLFFKVKANSINYRSLLGGGRGPLENTYSKVGRVLGGVCQPTLHAVSTSASPTRG